MCEYGPVCHINWKGEDKSMLCSQIVSTAPKWPNKLVTAGWNIWSRKNFSCSPNLYIIVQTSSFCFLCETHPVYKCSWKSDGSCCSWWHFNVAHISTAFCLLLIYLFVWLFENKKKSFQFLGFWTECGNKGTAEISHFQFYSLTLSFHL